jgi:uncharacterized protein with PQ loop repeat
MPRHNPTHLKRNKSKKQDDKIDKFVYIFAFGAPFFELPQLYAIYSRQSAANVSLLTWGFFSAASLAWLVYSIHHRLKPMIVSYSLFLIVEVVTVIGILLYN